MNNRHKAAVALLAAAAWLPTQGWAAQPESDPFATFDALDRAELGGARGGMMIGGIPVDFAVVIRTTVEGAIAQGLQTTLTVNDQGGMGTATTTPIGDAGGTTMANNSSANNGSGGVTMSVPGGTTILHQVIQDQVQTLIANTRSGVNLNHHTEVNVDMPGFNQMTQSYYAHSHVAQLGRDAALNGLGR